MINYNKVKLASLKLCRLRPSDREWVLNNLPDSFSSQVKLELDVIKCLNVENVDAILKRIESKDKEFDFDDKTSQLRQYLSQLSDIDILLFAKSVDEPARNTIINDCKKLKRGLLVKKLKLIHSAICTQNFKNLFVDCLLEDLGKNL